MRKLPAALLVLALAAPAARADWAPLDAPLPREPVRALVPVAGAFAALGARQLTIVEAGGARRAFTLAAQTDALTGFAAAGEAWYLASRRALWRSDDRGYSWRKAAALAPRDDNEILALGLDGAVPVVATPLGLRRPHAGALAPHGELGQARIREARAKAGRLAVVTQRGVFLAGPVQRLDVPGRPALTAVLAHGGETLVAAGAGVLRCGEGCRPAAAVGGAYDLAAAGGEYWAAATTGVYRWREGAAELASAGLPGAASALAASGGAVYAAAGAAVYRWADPATAAAEREAYAPPAPAGEPSIGAVRRMVAGAHPFIEGDAEGWRRRARWRAAAPRLGLTLGRSSDEKSGLTRGDTIALSTTENRLLIGPNGESVSRSSGRAVDVGVALTWELDELVFNPLEMNVSNELEDLFRLRESVMLDATRVYYERLRLRAKLAAERDPATRDDLALRLAELTAQLDFYTGGRFTAAAAGDAP